MTMIIITINPHLGHRGRLHPAGVALLVASPACELCAVGALVQQLTHLRQVQLVHDLQLCVWGGVRGLGGHLFAHARTLECVHLYAHTCFTKPLRDCSGLLSISSAVMLSCEAAMQAAGLVV